MINFSVKILICKHYFRPLNTYMRKGKDPDPEPYILLSDRNPGGPKRCGSGSATLNYRGKLDVNRHGWMRSSRVIRTSDCQCQRRNSSKFDASTLRHSRISGAADEAVLKKVHKKSLKNPPVRCGPDTQDKVGFAE